MKSRNQPLGWSRRAFLRGTGALGVGGMIATLPATTTRAAVLTSSGNDNLKALRKTDPKLVLYAPDGSIRSPRGEPKRIAVGPHGQYYIASGKFVTVLDKQGNAGVEFSAQSDVRGLAISKEGPVYVALKDHIEIFDSSGKRQAQWDSPGKKNWFTSLAVTDNSLYAADAGNRAVFHYDRSGKLLGRIGEKNKERNIPGLVVPSPYFDIKIGSDGLLWVANPGRHRVEGYTLDGQLEASWGETSFAITGFCGCCNPSYFARLPDGRFVTSEKGLMRIKTYSAKGEFEGVVAGVESFPQYSENLSADAVGLDVAVDVEGRILVADVLGKEVRIFSKIKATA